MITDSDISKVSNRHGVSTNSAMNFSPLSTLNEYADHVSFVLAGVNDSEE